MERIGFEPSLTLPPEPRASAVDCDECGETIASGEVVTLQESVMCQPCGALRAAILLDPNGPKEITARDIEHAAEVLAIVGPSLKARRLGQFAGVVRGSVS